MITLDARLAALSSPDLLAALDRTAALGREVTADLIALLAECDARQLYLAEGYGSLFDFSVGRLRLSGAQAYHRIQAARAARHFPLVLERLRAGRVTMTAVALLREHLTDGNCQKVLDWADGRSKREVELFVRGLDPKPEVPASLRRLASPCAKGLASVAADEPIGATGAAASTSTLAAGSQVDVSLPLLPAPPVPDVQASPVVTPDERAATGNSALTASPPTSARPLMAGRVEVHPLSPGRYSLRVTISQETHDKLRRAHDLLGHAMPGADLAVVLDRALTLLVARLESRKAGAPAKTRKTVHDEARPKAAPVAATALPTGAAGDEVGKGAGDARASREEAPPSGDRTAVETGGNPGMPAGSGAGRPASSQPRPDGSTAWNRAGRRYIPAVVRRAVWDRDGGRCAYVSASGVRCAVTARLEFHHRRPFAEGGPSTPENLVLACVRHNAWEARRWFDSDQSEFSNRRRDV